MKQIVEGFYNRIMNKELELLEYRLNICKNCKLYLEDDILGPMCNRKLYFNPKTNETSIFKKEGFVNGCGCILKAKCRVPEAKCIINKW